MNTTHSDLLDPPTRPDLDDVDTTGEAAFAHARWLIHDTLTELAYEDAKSARTLAATSVGVSALIAGFFAGDWNPSNLSPLAFTVWTTGAVLLLGALVVLGAAAVTRGGPRPCSDARELTFYGHAARHTSPDHLEVALRSAPYGGGHDLRRAATRLWNLARVLTRKKLLLRYGLCMAATGAVACIAGGLLGGT